LDKLELENAWREYRMDAVLGSWLGRMIDLHAEFNLNSYEITGEFLKEQIIEDTTSRLPSPGSPYWSECIDCPDWFKAMIGYSEFDPLEVLQRAKKLRKDKPQKKGKRLRAGRVVIKVRDTLS
jgi:hypothetical protein